MKPNTGDTPVPPAKGLRPSALPLRYITGIPRRGLSRRDALLSRYLGVSMSSWYFSPLPVFMSTVSVSGARKPAARSLA